MMREIIHFLKNGWVTGERYAIIVNPIGWKYGMYHYNGERWCHSHNFQTVKEGLKVITTYNNSGMMPGHCVPTINFNPAPNRFEDHDELAVKILEGDPISLDMAKDILSI